MNELEKVLANSDTSSESFES